MTDQIGWQLGSRSWRPQRHAALPGAASVGFPSPPARVTRRAAAALRFAKDGGPVGDRDKTSKIARPVRTSIWLDPRDASLIDRASGNSGLVQVMHVLHGSLMVPGWGRTVVGWVGAFMFLSCLTGIWLWWPLSGSLSSGLRWQRRNTTNANLH